MTDLDDWNRLLEQNFVVWERDDSDGWDTNMCALLMTPRGAYIYVSAAGCSCWSGEAETIKLMSLAHALSPLGVPDDMRNDELNAMSVRHDVMEELGLCELCSPVK